VPNTKPLTFDVKSTVKMPSYLHALVEGERNADETFSAVVRRLLLKALMIEEEE